MHILVALVIIFVASSSCADAAALTEGSTTRSFSLSANAGSDSDSLNVSEPGLGELPPASVSARDVVSTTATGLASAASLENLGQNRWRLVFATSTRASHSGPGIAPIHFGGSATAVATVDHSADLDLSADRGLQTISIRSSKSVSGDGNTGTLTVDISDGQSFTSDLADVPVLKKFVAPAGSTATISVQLVSRSRRSVPTVLRSGASDSDNQNLTLTVSVSSTGSELGDVDEIIGELQAIIQRFQSIADTLVAQEVPNIQALLAAGDRTGASRAFTSARTSLLSEGRGTLQEILSLCSDSTSTLRQGGDSDGADRVAAECETAREQAGSIQRDSLDALDAARQGSGSSSSLPRSIARNYIRFAERTASIYENNQRRTSRINARMIEHRQNAGDTDGANAVADNANQARQRITDVNLGRLQRLHDIAAPRLTGLDAADLVPDVSTARDAAMARIQAADTLAADTINNALTGG